MLSTLLYFAFVAAVGYYATTKGRSPIVWGLVAIIISPLIAAIILFFLKNLKEVPQTTFKPEQIDTPKTPALEAAPAAAAGAAAATEEEPIVDKPEVEGPKIIEEPAPQAEAPKAEEPQAPVAAVVEEPVAPAQAPAAEAPAANKCPYCDSELPAGAKFCGSCGAKL